MALVDLKDPTYLMHRAHFDSYPGGFPPGHYGYDPESFVLYCNILPDEKVLEVGMGGVRVS